MSPERAAIARGEPITLSLPGNLRVGLRVMLLVLALFVCVPLHYLYRAVAYGSPFPMLFLRWGARICGARVTTEGTALRRDVVFLSNHVSWLDILAEAGASGTAFVAKAEVESTPVVGWLSSLNRTVYVKREARGNVAAQINAIREAMADNWSVTIFPEGTTTDGQSLLPFKTSLLKMLEPPPPGVMVQPVVIDYGEVAEDLGWVGDESGLTNARRVLGRKGSFPVTIHYLEPFDPKENGNRKDIAFRARAEIEEKLRECLGKPLRDYAHDVAPVRYAGRKEEPDDPPT